MNSQINEKKRFYIHTLGCKVNQYESQAMREILLGAGFKECLSRDMADIYIINTCTVTQHADRESRYLAGMFHRTNPLAKIVVTGCYVERNADEISTLPGVSHIVKNDKKNSIVDILNDLGGATSEVGRGSHLTITGFKGHTKAFVKIQDGCENRCSYCKVPLVRGVLKSKPLDVIVKEVSGLVANDFKEIVLTGICLGAWGRDIFPPEISNSVGLKAPDLTDVLKSLERISGNFRIRISSIEMKYVTDEMIAFIAGSKKVCRHLHIPLQSGDDEILKRMNRPYTCAQYLGLIEKLKHSIKDIAISTDVMVAFPGETDENFINTMNFLKAVSPARTHIFTYSKRDGTAAAAFDGEVNEVLARKRYYNLRTIAIMLSYIYRAKFIGRTLDVLVESKRDRQTGLLSGYSDNYIKVIFAGDDGVMRTIAPVRIEEMSLVYTRGAYGPVSDVKV